jgi:hypothetical protein
MNIRHGHYGETSLDGVKFAAGYWWPGAVHEGNGMMQLAIDEHATPAQRNAIVAIASGTEGCAFFEIFSSVVSQTLEPIYTRIHLESDYERRTAMLKVTGLGEFRVEPIRNPVTGKEHRARIDLPNGFEFKVAEMANCVEHRATVGGKQIHNTNSYAGFAHVDWSNS